MNKEMFDFMENFDALRSYKAHFAKYINKFMGLKCAGDLLNLGIFPNAKEITETMSMFDAWQRFICASFPRNDKKVALVSVGDGRQPRTAAFFAFMTPWQCFSIDPNLDIDRYVSKKINRLHLIPLQVEEINIEFDKVLIVAVHSHARVDRILEHIKGKRRALIALPCCESSYYTKIRPPDLAYRDVAVWSPKRSILIWRDI